MRAEPKIDKLMEVSNLNLGDKVQLTDGSIAEFVRLKQKNFVGTMDGKSYNIPVNMFVEVVERVDLEAQQKEQEEEYKNLKQGELFYINKNGNAMLFKFDTIRNGKIIGKNLITNGGVRIDPALFGGKVSNL